MIVKIYFDESKKNCQVIRTTEKFKGDVKGLVEHVTKSNLEPGHSFVKRFHSFETV